MRYQIVTHDDGGFAIYDMEAGRMLKDDEKTIAVIDLERHFEQYWGWWREHRCS